MEVTITNACGRCKKTEARAVSVDEVIEAREKQLRRETSIEGLRSLINSHLSDGEGPEVIVCVKTGPNFYTVNMLDNLCDAPDGAARKKGCKQRVATLIDDIFLEGKSATDKKTSTSKKTSKTSKVPKTDDAQE